MRPGWQFSCPDLQDGHHVSRAACSSVRASEQLANQPHHARGSMLAHMAASRHCCCASHRTAEALKACARCTSACLRAVHPQCSPIIHDSSSGAGSQLLLPDLLAGRRSEADPPVGTVVLQTAKGPSVSRSHVHGLQPGFAADTRRSLAWPKLNATATSKAQLDGSHPSTPPEGVTFGAQLRWGIPGPDHTRQG